jgi:hypothetical protein
MFNTYANISGPCEVKLLSRLTIRQATIWAKQIQLRRIQWKHERTVDTMAAGTLAMMDMTGLRFSSMNVYENDETVVAL